MRESIRYRLREDDRALVAGGEHGQLLEELGGQERAPEPRRRSAPQPVAGGEQLARVDGENQHGSARDAALWAVRAVGGGQPVSAIGRPTVNASRIGPSSDL